ncbi:hypothetical protein D3C81_2023340 [compost metagenome]
MEEEQISHILSKQEEGSKGLFENIGLRSVNERLQLAFGEPYGLSIESKPGQFTQMKLLIPFQLKE